MNANNQIVILSSMFLFGTLAACSTGQKTDVVQQNPAASLPTVVASKTLDRKIAGSTVLLPDETKAASLRIKLDIVGNACGTVGVIRAWLLKTDFSPSGDILFTGDLEEGKTVEFKLPPADALRGRAVYLEARTVHVHCSGWLGLEAELVDAQTGKQLSGSSWREGGNASQNQMLVTRKMYEFEMSKNGTVD